VSGGGGCFVFVLSFSQKRTKYLAVVPDENRRITTPDAGGEKEVLVPSSGEVGKRKQITSRSWNKTLSRARGRNRILSSVRLDLCLNQACGRSCSIRLHRAGEFSEEFLRSIKRRPTLTRRPPKRRHSYKKVTKTIRFVNLGKNPNLEALTPEALSRRAV